LVLKFLSLKIIGRLDAKAVGKHLGDFCQQSGILWIKVGQLLAMRSDIFPRELCTEMARLQDRAEGFPFKSVKKIISQELGGPLEDFFSEFEETPWAAASIAQVHRARLKKEKVKVAIKVRRPDIDKVFNKDMNFISSLFNFLNRFSIMSALRWPDMLWELRQVLTEELDYYYELSNQTRLRKSLAKHQIYAPKIYHKYCKKNILVMEFIDAVSMADYLQLCKKDPQRIEEWLKKNNIVRNKVATTLLQSYLRQIFEDNLFHADLHPGNIFLLRDSRIALLDFGSIGTTEGDMLRKYDFFLEALVTGEYSKAIDVFLLMMPDLPHHRVAPAKEEMQRTLHSWGNRCLVNELPYREKSASFVFDTMMRIMSKQKVDINWAFFKMIRGWTTMDTSLRELHPGMNVINKTQQYTKSRRKREFTRFLLELPKDLLKLQNIIDYPREALEMSIYRGAMVRRLAQVFDSTTTRVSKLLARVFGLGSAFFFLCTLGSMLFALFQHTSIISSTHTLSEVLIHFPILDLQVWGLTLLFTIGGWRSLSTLASRFRQQE
jgi:ubiquinone biosynthesis protein